MSRFHSIILISNPAIIRTTPHSAAAAPGLANLQIGLITRTPLPAESN